MAQVLVRELRPEVVTRLKARARSRGRSLQSELKEILEQASRQGTLDARTVALRIRRRLAGRGHSDSARLLAEDRAR
jgi:antitoxin FitA